MPDQTRLNKMKDVAFVVGIGETDYRRDYQRAKLEPAYQDAYGYAAQAFLAALDDAGLSRDDIDGLVSGPATATERLGEVLGINPRWQAQGDAVNAVMQAVMAIHCGLAECVALVYGNDQRTAGTAYGGPNAMGGDRFLAYVYYAPWGLTSQGALYAMMINRYMQLTGFSPEDLGNIVVSQRAFAASNANAIMQKRLTIDDYLASQLICEPLRVLDYCLVNDGGVALIVTTKDRARRLAKPLVSISGIGRSDLNKRASSLVPRFIDFYHPAHRQAAAQVYEMAGSGPEDMDVVQIYDSFSAHIPFALEGFGFCREGEAASLIREGAIFPGGKWPVNTSGGMMSQSYMQGWNHQVEAVRQLRGQSLGFQVTGAKHAQYLSDVAGKVASIIYSGGCR